jgi:hypothetical protein
MRTDTVELVNLEAPAYVYRSENSHGNSTYVATCPIHARDISIRPDRLQADTLRDLHNHYFHGRV